MAERTESNGYSPIEDSARDPRGYDNYYASRAADEGYGRGHEISFTNGYIESTSTAKLLNQPEKVVFNGDVAEQSLVRVTAQPQKELHWDLAE